MEKKSGFFLLIGLVFFVHISYAQTINDNDIKNGIKSFLKLDIGFTDGMEWEQKLSKSSSINLFGGISNGLAADGFSLSNLQARLIISPETYAEYRNYYNLQHRINGKKKVKNNSANFLYGSK